MNWRYLNTQHCIIERKHNSPYQNILLNLVKYEEILEWEFSYINIQKICTITFLTIFVMKYQAGCQFLSTVCVFVLYLNNQELFHNKIYSVGHKQLYIDIVQ